MKVKTYDARIRRLRPLRELSALFDEMEARLRDPCFFVSLPSDNSRALMDALRGPGAFTDMLDEAELLTGEIGRLDCGFTIVETTP